MWKIMIVDDEYHIREGIKKTVPWSELGLDLIAEASNGSKAWNQFEEHLPEILLLDINISEISGIELAKRILANGHAVQIIFLTGYDDFQLVKEAVALGASDYLLKPVGYEDLIDALLKAIQKVEELNKQSSLIHFLYKKVDEYGKVAADRIFMEMLQQQRSLQESQEQLKVLNINLSEQAELIVINAEVMHYDSFMNQVSSKDRRTYIYAFRKLAQEILDEYGKGWLLLESSNQLLVIWEMTAPKNRLHIDFSRRFIDIFYAYFKMKVSIGLSNIVNGIEQLPIAYQQSKAALKHVPLLGEGHVIPYKVVEPGSVPKAKLVGNEILLLTELRLGNEASVRVLLDKWCVELKALSWEEAYLISSQVIVFVLRILSEINVRDVELLNVQPITELETYIQMEDLVGFLQEYIVRVVTAIGQVKEVPTHKVIEQAKQWIRENLDDDVSLTKLAEHLHHNANYLSQLFKQSMGETFMDYVTRVRLEKAKELLQDPHLKIFEVANRVGFKDANYFSIAFKNKIGASPSEYRQRYTQ